MFKKLTLLFIISLSILFNSIIAFADIQYFDNIDSLLVAHVWVDGLNVRAYPAEKSKIIDVVNANQQIEVVAKYPGWAKVCIALDSYGFINDYFIEYRQYTINSYDNNLNNQIDNSNCYDDYTYYTDENKDMYINDINNYQNYNNYYIEDNDYYDNQSTNNDNYYQEEQTYYENTIPEQNDYYQEEQQFYNEEEYCPDTEYYEEYEEEVYQDYQEEQQQIDNEEYFEEENQEVTTTSNGQYLVDYAQQYLGNPYVYGGTSLTNGTDCSGFTLSVLGDNGITVNGRTAADQAQGGTDVSLDQIEAGDLLFYDNGGGIGHVAIYNGDGTITHASSSATGITISDANYRTPVAAKRYW